MNGWTAAKHKVSGLSRREFFSRFADGLHGSALAYLLGGDLFSGPTLASSLQGHGPMI